ncbi:hypothetical protein BOTCAL_0830g00020 [Botryotinia calthae]|uniref:Uncharacterized protein n=1 Tax=Botryotinia calthae TaxID=38488 RepID=A0A4Y8CHR2_9HELO|nr:hypothetical protein BOTCAL_0830g00020 [Botryotinia calthae]
MLDNTAGSLRKQWSNPGDILSLLLLIGGDTVQKAIAQLVGYTLSPFGSNRLSVGLTPVAFSFGWVAYGFTNLLSVIGERKLMPTADVPVIVVNYGHLPSTSPEGRAESIRIDIFELGAPSKPNLDLVWWLGWVTIIAQIGIAIPPWYLNKNWGVAMIVLCGNFLAFLTCALPQWRQEKWAGRTLSSDEVTCLTRGNGFAHIMVFIGRKGSWNLETLATASSTSRPETLVISLILAVLWICLLISVSGLEEHAWYLVGIGGIGMLQNVYAAGKARDPGASDFHLTKFSRMPTIIGKRQRFDDDHDAEVDLDQTKNDLSQLYTWLQTSDPTVQMPRWLGSMTKEDGVPNWLEPIRFETNNIANVHGALQELEKWVPTAGLAMMQIFFPASLRYEDDHIRNNVHKKFWKRAYHTKDVRKKAEHKRRESERNYKGKDEHENSVFSTKMPV